MSNPSDWQQDPDGENEYDEEEEEGFLEETDDHAHADEDDDGDDLSEAPELRSCLGAVVAAIAFWLGLALTALCFCAVFAVALHHL